MADEPTPTEEPKPEPVPAEEPEWVKGFFAKLDAKLSSVAANVTEDNERSIAERVYDLFDSGGAFEKPEPTPKAEPETEEKGDPVTPEPAPKKHGRFMHLASKFAGEQ